METRTGLTGIIAWVKRVYSNMRPYLEEKEIVAEKDPTLVEEIEEARKQWQEARNYFNSVSEPELVDHAAYMIEAARVKYMYLLNKAKQSGLKTYEIMDIDDFH